MGERVLVFNLDRPVLTFHEYGGHIVVDLADGWRRAETRTLCGRVFWRIEWLREPGEPQRERRRVAASVHYLRREHADLKRLARLKREGRLVAVKDSPRTLRVVTS